jgi:hypothetical protein
LLGGTLEEGLALDVGVCVDGRAVASTAVDVAVVVVVDGTGVTVGATRIAEAVGIVVAGALVSVGLAGVALLGSIFAVGSTLPQLASNARVSVTGAIMV